MALQLENDQEAASLADIVFKDYYGAQVVGFPTKPDLQWDEKYTTLAEAWHGFHAVGVPHDKLFRKDKIQEPYKTHAYNNKEVSS